MKKIIILFLIALIVLVLWTIWGNTAVELNKHTIASDRIPKEFEGFKIAQISDLHNAEIGNNNEKILELMVEAEPDIIVITGDMVDSRRPNIEVAFDFAKEALKIAPCYYVNGNHELRMEEYEEIRNGLEKLGVKILENQKVLLSEKEAEITLIGVSDPSVESMLLKVDEDDLMKSYLDGIVNDDDNYKILLSHRPELIDVYADSKIDLAFTGHAHGGQVRLPIIGGIVAPKQGFFPKYDSGLYIEEETNMIVSRGIGNSLFPLRFNNRPEVVLIELQAR